MDSGVFENKPTKVDINVGRSLDTFESKSKEQQYAEIRANIRSSTLINIMEILNVSTTRLNFYSRLEDSNIPLIYLIALGITTESDIKSYETMRSRGIDTYSTGSEDDFLDISEGYAREIESLRKDVPTLLDLEGRDIEASIKGKERRLKEWEERLKQKEMELLTTPIEVEEEKYDPKKDNSLSGAFGSVVEEPVVLESEPISEVSAEEPLPLPVSETKIDIEEFKDIYEDIEKEQEEKEQKKGESKWLEILENFQEDYQTGHSGPISNYEKDKERDRIVYILGDRFYTPQFDGYTVEFINKPSDIRKFTASKRDILVLSNDIPEDVVDGFLNFVRSIRKFDDRYRITKLEGVKFEHESILGEITLTQDGLDRYFTQFPDDDFTNSGVGQFQSLEAILFESGMEDIF